MLIPDKPGITQWLTCIPNSHHNHFSVKDKSQMFLNGSDLNNSVRVPHQDFSSMKFHTHGGTETEVISITQKTLFILSLMLIKSHKSISVLTLPLQKEENNGKENAAISAYAPEIVPMADFVQLHDIPKFVTKEPHFQRVWITYQQQTLRNAIADGVASGAISSEDSAAAIKFLGSSRNSLFVN
jgi:hypothetical protein